MELTSKVEKKEKGDNQNIFYIMVGKENARPVKFQ